MRSAVAYFVATCGVVGFAMLCILRHFDAVAQEAESEVTGPLPQVAQALSKHDNCPPGAIHIARLQLRESTLRVDPMSDINLIQALRERTHLNICPNRLIIKLDGDEIFKYPFVLFEGEHKPMNLNAAERDKLRRYLLGGGFLYVDECPAKLRLRPPLKEELQAIVPEHKFERLPITHPLYHCVYDIRRIVPARRNGVTYHEGISINGRLVLVYSINGEGCSWQSWRWMGPLCACLPPSFDYAFEFGVNLVYYALTH